MNVSQENEVENVLFDKNKEYAVTGMAIKPDIVDSDIVKVINKKKTWNFKQKNARINWKKKRTRFRSKNS